MKLKKFLSIILSVAIVCTTFVATMPFTNAASVHEHVGGKANCVTPAICEECGEQYGEVDKNAHIGHLEIRNSKKPTEFEDGYRGDFYCSSCGELVSKGYVIPKLTHTHKFVTENSDDASHWMECVCGARENETPHNFGQYSSDATGHSHTCADCGRTVTESHTPNADDLDCSTPTTCSICGYVIDEARAHTWGAWYSDGENHVSECLNENCDAVTKERHTGGVATCNSPAVCDTCALPYGEKDAQNHVGGTEIRDYSAPTEDDYGYSGDTYCLGCDAKIAEGERLDKLPPTHKHSFKEDYDGVGHWLVCECGTRQDNSYAEHTFNGYIETADGHSRACTECGYVSDVEIHIPGDNNNCETAVYCTVCMYEISPAKTHSFDGVLFSDEYGHWHVCTNEGCTQIDDKIAHSGGTATCSKKAVCNDCFAEYGELDAENHAVTELRNYKEATEEEDGYTGDIYCTECGTLIKEGAVIQKLETKPEEENPPEAEDPPATIEPDETDPETEKPDTTQPSIKDDVDIPNTGNGVYMHLCFVVLILLCAAMCIIVFIKRRRKYE